MIHVNVRGFIVRKWEKELQVVIQLRKREGEPEVYELPGGRINEFEKITDGLRREVMEETGLKLTTIYNEADAIITSGNGTKAYFAVECIKPFAAYQTIQGPVDSFGIYFICEAEGELLTKGDDTDHVHWESIEGIQKIIQEDRFSEIDMPAMMMFLRDVGQLNF